MGEGFDVVAATERIDHLGDPGLFGQDELSVTCYARREFCWKCNCFVEGIGVQALGPTKHRGKGFNGGSHDVVHGVLFSERHTRGLAVRAQHH